MPRSKITNNNASPNTADGFASGSRSVTMMSSRNGRMAESAGTCVADFPPDFTRRAAQPDATTKKIANPARIKSAVGKPVSSLGIRQNHAPTATNVSTSTPMTGNSVAVVRARTIATRSTINTDRQRKLSELKDRYLHEQKGEHRKDLAPRRDVDLTQALQCDWRRRMKEREHKIKSKRDEEIRIR